MSHVERELWFLESTYRLTTSEFLEGRRLGTRHRSGGRGAVVGLTVGILVGFGMFAMGLLILTTAVGKDREDGMQMTISGAILPAVLGMVLLWPYVRRTEVVGRETDATLRYNEFDIEVERSGSRQRWGWPEWFVFLEGQEVYVLMRKEVMLTVPKRVVPPDHVEWFRYIGVGSTQPRREVHREFPVIVEQQKPVEEAEGSEESP